MKKFKITLGFLFLVCICIGQEEKSIKNTFFADQHLKKQVAEKKAKFVQTVLEKSDGIRIIEVRNLKSNELISYESFKGEEPIGKWLEKGVNSYDTLDYDFNLVYSNENCIDNSNIEIDDYFQSNESVGYKAPVIDGGIGIFQYIVNNLSYPSIAVEKGIQGHVLIQFSIAKNGLEDIFVKKGVDKAIDKEAVRVMKKLKFNAPPMLKGQNVDFNCVFIPIKFSLQ
jgi:TonB family protein